MTVSLILNAQDKTIDSLKLALKTAKYDTSIIKTSLELGETIYLYNPKDALGLWTNAKILAEKGATTASPTTAPFYLKHLALVLNNIGFIVQQRGDIP